MEIAGSYRKKSFFRSITNWYCRIWLFEKKKYTIKISFTPSIVELFTLHVVVHLVLLKQRIKWCKNRMKRGIFCPRGSKLCRDYTNQIRILSLSWIDRLCPLFFKYVDQVFEEWEICLLSCIQALTHDCASDVRENVPFNKSLYKQSESFLLYTMIAQLTISFKSVRPLEKWIFEK